MSKESYISWNSDAEKSIAFSSAGQNVDSYDGILSSSASRRTYLDIEPNISVRPEFTKDDYYRFRNNEDPEGRVKETMAKCMKAYDKVGIVKNVIDLMGDFASQGITLLHENKNIEKFYRRWWHQVNGHERSERFLNMLYRCGNVIIYKRYGKITKKIQKNMSKGADIEYSEPEVIKKEIPFKYDFLNPLSVSVEDDSAGVFSINTRYKMRLSSALKKSISNTKNKDLLSTLPDGLKRATKSGAEFFSLPPERIEVFTYKKDDWQSWANPMIYAILDDITMLEKMKLADMSALDGAISNIRLWKLGNLEHKILPTRASIDRLRNILASNVGGGTMDLIWGPEIEFIESDSQVYKFLGMEKYNPVLSSIYAGMGIPPTLTGASGQSGGFTNNFISLKTLIERLEYGRELLKLFWQKEIEHVQKAMGFPLPAILHFDHMILSDEVAEKNLLMQLADRDIISSETLRERLGESTPIEESRIKTENKKRKSRKLPPKADPFHNGNVESDYIKTALTKDTLSIEDVTEYKARKPPVQPGSAPTSKKPKNNNGRPPFKTDTSPRKQKRVLPRSKADMASLLIWSSEAQREISNLMNPCLLSHYGKKNLRELSKEEHADLEKSKFKVLCGIEPFGEINESSVLAAIESNNPPYSYSSLYADFMKKNKRTPTIEEMRQIYALAYSLSFF